MFRLLAVLCLGLYLAMLIGGQDRGQVRFGLMPQKAETQDAFAVAQGAASEAESEMSQVEPSTATAPQAGVGDLQIVSASFAPEKPLMVAPAALDVTPVALEVEAPAVDEVPGRVFYVNAESVNVREGPGKDHAVLDRLPRGEAVLVLVEGEGPEGWSLVRVEGDGVEGYVATRLLRE